MEDAPTPVTREYLDIIGVADLAGVKHQTARKWSARGKLPEPDARIGRQPGWLPETITGWMRTRDKLGL